MQGTCRGGVSYDSLYQHHHVLKSFTISFYVFVVLGEQNGREHVRMLLRSPNCEICQNLQKVRRKKRKWPKETRAKIREGRGGLA